MGKVESQLSFGVCANSALKRAILHPCSLMSPVVVIVCTTKARAREKASVSAATVMDFAGTSSGAFAAMVRSAASYIDNGETGIASLRGCGGFA